MRDDGQAQYVLTVEFTLARPASGELPDRQFWQETVSYPASSLGAATPYEVGGLVRGFNAQALDAVNEGLKKEAMSPTADTATAQPPPQEQPAETADSEE